MTTGGYPPPPNTPDPNEPFGSGSTPPPPGSMPPPPGSMPPPPGSTPPIGGGGDWGQPPRLAVGTALAYAWRMFTQNLGFWLPWGILLAVLSWLGGTGGQSTTSSSTDTPTGADGNPEPLSGGEAAAAIGLILLIIFIAVLVGAFIQGALTRVVLLQLDGQRTGFTEVFKLRNNIGAIVLAAILVGLGTMVGTILLLVPGIIFAFLAYWTMLFVVDQNQDAITAIKSSFSTISANAGTLFLLALANVAIVIVGSLLFGIGLIVAYPIMFISSTYAYRVVTGRYVAQV